MRRAQALSWQTFHNLCSTLRQCPLFGACNRSALHLWREGKPYCLPEAEHNITLVSITSGPEYIPEVQTPSVTCPDLAYWCSAVIFLG